MTKMIAMVVLILLLASLGAIGIYYKYNNESDSKVVPGEVVLKEDMDVEFFSEVKVSDFILSINGEIEDDYLIDTTTLGEKIVEYNVIDKDGNNENRSFTINVKDTVPPLVRVSSTYTVNVGSADNLTKNILCGDNYDSNPTCEILGEYDLNKIGTYPVTFRAVDNSGNETLKNFDLKVVEPSNNSSSTNTSKTLFSDVVKKYKTENTEIGLDISEWQDYPDFNKLKEAGVEFVFLRVGGTKLRTGEYFLDASFKYNIENAKKAGIPVGVYFYSYAKNKLQVVKDAEWIYEQIKDYEIPLGVAFDWENWGFYNDFHLSFYELTEMSNAYLGFFKDKGYVGLLYSSMAYLEDIWLPQSFPVWMAHYTRNMEISSYAGEYSYWQLCSNGAVDGINGNVDINIRYKK